MRPTSVLRLEGVGKNFGGLAAIRDIDLDVEDGQICSIIGPNGAGKTTLLNVITGVHSPSQGRIRFDAEEITGLSPEAIASRGISRTFQNIRLFPHLSSLENVIVGCSGAMFRKPRALAQLFGRSGFDGAIEAARTWMEWVGFSSDPQAMPGELPYAEQRRLELARALATGPRLLILDELTAGMIASEARGIIKLIAGMRDRGINIVLIEHNMHVVNAVSDRIVVLNFGEKIAEGVPAEVMRDQAVVDAYLGTA